MAVCSQDEGRIDQQQARVGVFVVMVIVMRSRPVVSADVVQ